MSDEFTVKMNGKTYRWSYDPSVSIPEDCWSWADEETQMTPPATVIHRLNHRLLDRHAETLLKKWGQVNLARFCAILRSLGATDGDFRRLGLDFLIESDEGTDWRPRSPLHAMGYRVGKHGLSTSQRQAILQSAFTGPLPNVGAAGYMALWGLPGSEERLRKIVFHILHVWNFVRPADADYTEACEQWRADLNWLKATFYDEKFAFPWPGAS